MNVVLLTVTLLAIGFICVALLVASIRQNRDDADALEARLRAALEKSEGDPAGTDRRDARQHPEARVIPFPLDPIETSMYELAEFGGPILFDQQVRR